MGRWPETFWTERDWRGASVFVASSAVTQDIAPIVEACFADAHFIVVGTREEARLVVRLEQRETSKEAGSVSAQHYSGTARVVDAIATYDGTRVAEAHVDLHFTVAMREGESWAEYRWREDLEEAAADKYVGGRIVEQILERVPLRASVNGASTKPAAKEGEPR